MLIIAIAVRHADLHADFAMVRSTSDGRDGRIVELVAKWRFSLISCKACLRVARRAERSARQSDIAKVTGIRARLTWISALPSFAVTSGCSFVVVYV